MRRRRDEAPSLQRITERLEAATPPRPATCSVPGCYGVLHFETDGAGRTVNWCPDCERRCITVRAMGRKFAPGQFLETAEERLIKAEGRMMRAESSCEHLSHQIAALRQELTLVLEYQEQHRPKGQLPQVGPVRSILLSLPHSKDTAATASEAARMASITDVQLVRVVLNQLWNRQEINRVECRRSGVQKELLCYWRAAA